MPSVLLIITAGKKRDLMLASLAESGLEATCLPDIAKLALTSVEQAPSLVVIDVASLSASQVEAALDRAKEWEVPCVTLLTAENLSDARLLQRVDDFILDPVRSMEIATRIRRLLRKNGDIQSAHVLKLGDLAIDEERYEVRVAGDIKLLTYKEYELLRLLAANPGRVFSREELLSKVWGYDYFGGTRTVDVHIRRLRSKIEDLNHSFIETIWNVGYRFKAPAA